MKKEIGGYFQLELREGKHFHEKAVKLNLGRTAFELLLEINKYKKIYLPAYVCESVLEPVRKTETDYEFYNINEKLEPIFDKSLLPNEAFYYVNYFGIKNDFIATGIKYGEQVIIDNAHAFFDSPQNGFETFYSARKFFGVPEGSYLYTSRKIEREITRGKSYDKAAHLLIRIDEGAEAGYKHFLENERKHSFAEIKRMSFLSEAILRNIDYPTARRRRSENFKFLHENLCKINEMTINLEENASPLCYPLLIKSYGVREKLIENKIFVPIYWKDALIRDELSNYEKYLTENLLPLPVDQRYGKEEMDYILKAIGEATSGK